MIRSTAMTSWCRGAHGLLHNSSASRKKSSAEYVSKWMAGSPFAGGVGVCCRGNADAEHLEIGNYPLTRIIALIDHAIFLPILSATPTTQPQAHTNPHASRQPHPDHLISTLTASTRSHIATYNRCWTAP